MARWAVRRGWLLYVACGLVVAAAQAAAAGAVVKRIEVSEDTAKATATSVPTVIRVHLSAAPAGPPRVKAYGKEGDASARIVVDVPGTKLGKGGREAKVGFGSVIRVRLGQPEPTTARVVVDLERELPFTIDDDAESVTITLASPPGSPDPATDAAPKVGGAAEDGGVTVRIEPADGAAPAKVPAAP